MTKNNNETALVHKDIWEIHKFKACFCAPERKEERKQQKQEK